jgi:hypothetical protein
MNTRAMTGVLLLLSVSYAGADDAEKLARTRVRLSTEATVAAGCTRLGMVTDDSIKDLRRKIVKAGGDTGILSFGMDDTIYAQVFQCPTAVTPPAPPNVPPPPGVPPPPPPGPSR